MLGIWRNICVGTLRCKNQKNKTDCVSQWKNAIIILNYYRQQERVIAGRYTVCTLHLSTSSFKAVRVLLKVALGIPVPHLPHHSRLRRRVSQEDYACFCLPPIMDRLSLHHPNHWFQRAFHVCGLPRPFARRFGQTNKNTFKKCQLYEVTGLFFTFSNMLAKVFFSFSLMDLISCTQMVTLFFAALFSGSNSNTFWKSRRASWKRVPK